MGRGGTVLGIIGIILAAGAIGFTFIVWNGQNTSYDLPRTIVVGIWDALDENEDFAPHNYPNDWLVEFGDNNLSNTDYISVSNTNTRITLLKSGWYRIHLSVILAGISPSSIYVITIFKDGAVEFYLHRYETLATSVAWFYNIDSSAFVYSNGTNYIEISGSSNDDFQFSIDLYNQLSIEYVVP